MKHVDRRAKLTEKEAAQAHADCNSRNGQVGPSMVPHNSLRNAIDSRTEIHQSKRQPSLEPIDEQQRGCKQGNMQKKAKPKPKSRIGRERGEHQALLKYQYGTSSGARGAPRRRLPVQLTKERHLQATCQLLVSDWSGYEVNTTDPDVAIDWSSVVQVRLYSATELVCPVCLEEPKAARITRCGHCFCLSCLLHYLATAAGVSRRCPLCNETVSFKDVRSVAVRPSKAVAANSHMEMRLVAKNKASTMVYPTQLQSCCTNQGFVPYAYQAEDSQFGNVLRVSAQDAIGHIISKEKEEIGHHRKFLRSIGDETEIPFLGSALRFLEKWKLDIKAKQMASSTALNTKLLSSLSQTTAASAGSMNHIERQSHGHRLAGKSVDEVKLVRAGESHQYKCVQPASPLYLNDLAHFYQASDGQHVYLHSFNTRCLTHTYGTLDQCPASISGTVVEIEEMIMTEKNRRKFRHLSHLALGTPFSLVELDLWECLDATTRNQFEGELQARRRRQNERLRAEEIAANKAAENFSHQAYHGTDLSQFPSTATTEESISELETIFSHIVVTSATPCDAMADAARPSFAHAARPRVHESQHSACTATGQRSGRTNGWATLPSSASGIISAESENGNGFDGDDLPAVPDYRAAFASDVVKTTLRGGARVGSRGMGTRKDRKRKALLFTAG